MHEMGIAQNILEIIRQAVPEAEATSVRLIRLRIGQLSGVVPDSLEFCFQAIVSDTDMRKANLAIEPVPTVFRCKKCENRFQVNDLEFSCPKCRNTDLEIVSGRELEVVEIELEEESDRIP